MVLLQLIMVRDLLEESELVFPVGINVEVLHLENEGAHWVNVANAVGVHERQVMLEHGLVLVKVTLDRRNLVLVVLPHQIYKQIKTI